jgi:2-polyprenyl-6-methoxyphenol hydroxylase-like FAD-dependent oxidoreductase
LNLCLFTLPHERASDLRAFGSGVTCWNNFARVLEAVGALSVIKPNAHDIVCRETRDRDNRVLYSFDQSASRGDVSFTLTRGDLLSGLAAVAQTMGVEIRTSSRVVSADASGSLTLESGERRAADLIVAADGVNSAIRDGLELLKTRKTLGEGSIRLLLPGAADSRGRHEQTARRGRSHFTHRRDRTAWLMTQSISNRSRLANSLLAGNSAGNFADSAVRVMIRPDI